MEVKSNDHIAALMKAAWEGDTGRAQALLHEGVDVNAKDAFGRTALIIAAARGHTYIVQVLIESGADPRVRDNVGTTALVAAESRGYSRIVSLLRGASTEGEESHSLKTDSGGASPASLQRAVDNGDVDNVNALIAQGAQVDARTDDGWTPLMLATIKGHTGIVEALLNKGADVNARNKKSWTALMFAVSMGDIDTMRVLLAGGADINARDHDGKTVLMQAAGENNIECLKVLLDHEADVNSVDRVGETALTIAARRGYTEIVALLKEAGAMGDTSLPVPTKSVLDLPQSMRTGTEPSFNEGELLRLKEELDEFLPQTWPTAGSPDAAPETPGALVPAHLAELGERLIAALEALRPVGPAAKPSLSLADLAHKLMLTLPEAAALSSLSRDHLRRAIKKGALKAQIIGRGWRIKRADLDAYVSAL
jgi:excisionase family DNA binding protein